MNNYDRQHAYHEFVVDAQIGEDVLVQQLSITVRLESVIGFIIQTELEML